jgi:hypothetical protein
MLTSFLLDKFAQEISKIRNFSDFPARPSDFSR